MRCKALTLAHPTVGRTLFSDTLGPTWRLLKLLDGPESRISRSAEIRNSGPSNDFKSRDVGPKVSANKVRPTVGCARVRALQRTSNSNRTTNIRTYNKMCLIRSQRCRTALIRSALESPDPGAFNGGSNFEIKILGADLVPFEVVSWPQNNFVFSREIFVN